MRRVVILGRHPQELATPLLGRLLLRRRCTRLPWPRLWEPREAMVDRRPVVHCNRAPLKVFSRALLRPRCAPAVTSSTSVVFAWTSRTSAGGKDPPAAATSSDR